MRDVIYLDRIEQAEALLKPQRIEVLRLEQGFSLLDPVEVDDVSHGENKSLRKTFFCQ